MLKNIGTAAKIGIGLTITQEQVLLLGITHQDENGKKDQRIQGQKWGIQQQAGDRKQEHLAHRLRVAQTGIDAAVHLMIRFGLQDFLSGITRSFHHQRGGWHADQSRQKDRNPPGPGEFLSDRHRQRIEAIEHVIGHNDEFKQAGDQAVLIAQAIGARANQQCPSGWADTVHVKEQEQNVKKNQ